jgi:hypothetical protein
MPELADRAGPRPLDQRLERTDVCPKCGGERQELPLPDQFYCERCEKASSGPNTEPPPEPEPEPLGLFSVSELGADEEPLPDEGMAWVGEEGPDE